MLIHNRMESSTVNGPGNRAVIWTAGCSLGCRGCWNPDTHQFDRSKEINDLDLLKWFEGLQDIEGITLSGGEPMQQSWEVGRLLDNLKKLRPNLSVGMYTGYTEKELDQGKFKCWSEGKWNNGSAWLWNEVKKCLDFAIMGRYVESRRSSARPLCGSTNQEVVFFTDRYGPEDLDQQSFEVIVDENTGLYQITGFPIGIDPDSI